MFTISFGNRFKKLRLDKGLTQDELVEEFNDRYGYSFTKSAISQYENDKRIPEMSTLKSFVEYFDVSLDYLLCNDISIVNELGGPYGIYKRGEAIELQDIISLIKGLVESKNIKFKGDILNEEQEKLLKNCIDITFELIKKENAK